jgi:Periplasmic copper-binding protein (NosD)
LTLEGVASQTGTAVVSTPAAGLTQTVASDTIGTIAFQILVQSTGPVTISNLIVDGTNAANSSAGFIAGIVYMDSSGTVAHVSARYQMGGGIGILAFTTLPSPQTVTITSNFIHGFDALGVLAQTGEQAGSLTANVNANTIRGGGQQTTGVSSNGNGTIQGNAITDVRAGIQLLNSGATVTANTIFANSVGLNISSGSGSVISNRIDAGGYVGVSLGNSATSFPVQKNTIGNSSTAVYGCGDGVRGFIGAASGFTVTSNNIIDAATGVQMPSTNTSAPNTFYATVMDVQACP